MGFCTLVSGTGAEKGHLVVYLWAVGLYSDGSVCYAKRPDTDNMSSQEEESATDELSEKDDEAVAKANTDDLEPDSTTKVTKAHLEAAQSAGSDMVENRRYTLTNTSRCRIFLLPKVP